MMQYYLFVIPSKTTIYVAQTEWIMKQPKVMQITSRIINWIDNNFLVDDTCESDTKQVITTKTMTDKEIIEQLEKEWLYSNSDKLNILIEFTGRILSINR